MVQNIAQAIPMHQHWRIGYVLESGDNAMLLRTEFYYIPNAMTGFIVSVYPFRNRVSSKEAFEGLELGEGKPSRAVLRGPGGRKAAWLLGSNSRKTERAITS